MNTPSSKARPIIFSTSMVRAILNGKKTQTRRVVTPQPIPPIMPIPSYRRSRKNTLEMDVAFGPNNRHKDGRVRYWQSPYGMEGDHLWVRETWGKCPTTGNIKYRADGEIPGIKWSPSIFMPIKVARINLEIIRVDIEQIQNISEEDAIAEGLFQESICMDIQCNGGSTIEVLEDRYFWKPFSPDNPGYDSAIDAYQDLWDSINSGRGYGWDTNPWVWVVEFRKVEI
ncbi:MAG: hypothetical protein HQL76_06045 [Magnetococcales bacterium]|nr:hypothetical protein [Magnetococcales bacterium]